MIKYVFKDAPVTFTGSGKADPQKIGEALSSIAAKSGGELKPHAVVEAAMEPTHVLHPHFEWDDKKAAAAYRVDQARNIIRSIHVEDAQASDGHAVAFISISEKSGTSYRSLADVKNSADLQTRVLAQADRDLDAFERRYRALQDVCEIIRTARAAVQRRRSNVDSRVGA